MRKIFIFSTALFIIYSFTVLKLSAQAVSVSDENELNTAIAGYEPDLLILNNGFSLTGAVDINNYPSSLYIHTASTPAYFSGGSSGQIFSIEGSTVSFDNIGFKDMDGGIFMHTNGSIVNFENAAFENNNYNISYESAFLFDTNSIIGFTGDTNFTENTGYFGGGFHATYANITFGSKIVFNSNEAVAGGGFYTAAGGANTGSRINFNGEAEFLSNKAIGASGGGFFVTASEINFNDKATFVQNETVTDGGAGLVSISDVNFGGFASFRENKAGISGGALYIEKIGEVDLSAGSEFIDNEALDSGGAIYLHESLAVLQNASFTNNKAGVSGGAIFVRGHADFLKYSELYINTVNNGPADNKTIFQGNTAGGEPNAVYFAELSSAVFNTASGASVEMYDGIKSDTDTAFVTVTGAGNFNLYAQADLYNLELDAGNFNIISESAMNVVNLTADRNSVLNTQNGLHTNVINVKNFDFDGTLKLGGGGGQGLDGDKVVAETASLGTNSKLNITTDTSVNTTLDYRKRYYRVLNYEVLTGSFSSVTVNNNLPLSSVSIMNKIKYADNWLTVSLSGNRLYTDFSLIQGLSHNQMQTAKTFDIISGNDNLSLDLDEQISTIDAYVDDNLKKAALLDASGYFLANVIRSAVLSGSRHDIYSRLRYHDTDAHNLSGIWTQVRTQAGEFADDENSKNKYKNFETGVLAGWDIMLEKRSMALGFFGKYDRHDIKQDPKSEATIDEFGFGVYGGILKEDWEIKTLISGSGDNFNTVRYIRFADRKAEADFSAFTFGLDFEAAIRSYVTESILLRPFAGIEIKTTSYDSFEEKNAGDLSLKVDSGNYSRSFARIGLGVGSDDGGQIEWYANIEGKYLLTKDSPEITASFISTSERFNSEGAKEGGTAIGFGAGGAYKLSRKFKIFANASYQHTEGYQNIYGNFGVRYMLFGSGK